MKTISQRDGMLKRVKNLQRFANSKSKGILDKPVEIEIEDLPRKKTYYVTSRAYNLVFDPKDKRRKPTLVRYGIQFDRQYLKESDDNELKQATLHELAHHLTFKRCGRTRKCMRHGAEFKKSARQLGVDPNHQRQYWK